jgi:hypothetical protein
MQNNPDVNSLNIGEEPESHPENTKTSDDSGKTNVENIKKPVRNDEKSAESANDVSAVETARENG